MRAIRGTLGSSEPRTIAECEKCPVRATSFCRGVPAGDIRFLFQSRQKVAVRKRQSIRDGGSAGEHYNIVQGVVKISRSTGDGRTQIIGFRGPGEFIVAPDGATYASYVEAVTDVYLCRFSQKDLDALMLRYPLLQSQLLGWSIHQIELLEEHALLLGRKTAREKLASFLQRRCSRVECSCSHFCRIEVPMTRMEIGDFLGLTPETVSRTLVSFKQEGLISFGHGEHIWLTDLAKLERIADVDMAPRNCTSPRMHVRSSNAGGD